MTAYYNEFDPYAAAWLRNLISAGHIAPGDVDERSILDVRPDDLRGYTQCHFFAGIGVWSAALRGAGWPDDRPVWTGSCPCQPFSAAGKGEGFADERHLWPYWHYLIEQCRPEIVFGEQVASKDGLGWLDLVQSDMEGTGYACWPVDMCAAGVGAPHIRQRLWFVGEDALVYPAHHGRIRGELGDQAGPKRTPLGGRQDERRGRHDIVDDGGAIGLADTASVRREQQRCAESVAVQGVCAERSREHSEPNETRELPGRSEGLGRPRGLADTSSQHIRRGFGEGNGAPNPSERETRKWERGGVDDSVSGADGQLADTDRGQHDRSRDAGPRGRVQHPIGGADSRVADANGARSATWLPASGHREKGHAREPDDSSNQFGRGAGAFTATRPGPTNGRWRDVDWAGSGLGNTAVHGHAPAEKPRNFLRVEQRAGRPHEQDVVQPAATGRAEFNGIHGRPPCDTANVTGPTNGHWRDADWLFCRDGKWRPVEPGTFPLAHGATARVGRLRAYGNAIVRQAAEAIIACKLEHDAERIRLTGLSEMNDIGGIFS